MENKEEVISLRQRAVNMAIGLSTGSRVISPETFDSEYQYILQHYKDEAELTRLRRIEEAARELLDNAKSALAAHEDIACSCKGCFGLRPSITRASAALKGDK